MPHRKDIRWAQLRVGAMVTASLIIFAVAIFLISGQIGHFSESLRPLKLNTLQVPAFTLDDTIHYFEDSTQRAIWKRSGRSCRVQRCSRNPRERPQIAPKRLAPNQDYVHPEAGAQRPKNFHFVITLSPRQPTRSDFSG